MTRLIISLDGEPTSPFGQNELRVLAEIARIGCFGTKFQRPLPAHTYLGTMRVLSSLGLIGVYDRKLNEIGNSLRRMLWWTKQMGIHLTTVRIDEETLLGLETVIRAKEVDVSQIIGVALYSTITDKMLKPMRKTREEIMVPRVKWAHRLGIRKFVTPNSEVALHRAYSPSCEAYVVGMRTGKAKKDDQALAATPEAIGKVKPHAIIFGRPVTTSNDPVAEYTKIRARFPM